MIERLVVDEHEGLALHFFVGFIVGAVLVSLFWLMVLP
jgi:uncharacterized membrane protein YciS (DUF1049 family)